MGRMSSSFVPGPACKEVTNTKDIRGRHPEGSRIHDPGGGSSALFSIPRLLLFRENNHPSLPPCY